MLPGDGDLDDRVRKLEARLRQLELVDRLISASIGPGDLRLLDGGSIKIEGGNLDLLDLDGNVRVRMSQRVDGGFNLIAQSPNAGDAEVVVGTIFIPDGGGQLTSHGILVQRETGEDLMRVWSGEQQEVALLPGTGARGLNLQTDSIGLYAPTDELILLANSESVWLSNPSGATALQSSPSGVWVAHPDGADILAASAGATDIRRPDGTLAFRANPAGVWVVLPSGATLVGAGATQVFLNQPNGDTVVVGSSSDVELRRPNDSDAIIWGTNTQTSIRRPNGTGASIFVENGDISLVDDVTVFGAFDVTGSKNAAIEAPDGNVYRFGADESPHAGRLIYDFDVTVSNGSATVLLPDSLGMVAEGSWVRGPWPQGHPGGNHYGAIDGDTLTVHGADGRYMVEVVAYRSDEAVASWAHVKPKSDAARPGEGPPSRSNL